MSFEGVGFYESNRDFSTLCTIIYVRSKIYTLVFLPNYTKILKITKNNFNKIKEIFDPKLGARNSYPQSVPLGLIGLKL